MEQADTTRGPAAAGRPEARPLAAGRALPLAALLVLAAALLPRSLGLADFLTTDEAYHWIARTERFSAALAAGDWAGTIQTGHPGVSLMWLGGLGLWLERAAVALGWAAAPDRLGHLAWLRLGPAVASSLCVGLGYLLLRRLLGPPAALLAALLWASSPYLVAHGRLLHLDSLLASFVSLSLLAALAAARAARPWPWLAGSGLACGLALLTKGPALILLPFVGLMLFGFALARRLDETRHNDFRAPLGPLWPALRALADALGQYLLWLGVAAAAALALWPALWAAPEAALARYIGEILGNGGRPNGDGQFFLGQAVADPGPLFYLVAGAFRLTPPELLGLLLLPLAVAAAPRQRRPALIALAAFVLWWTLVMSLGPKKFDRYTLPTWPALMALSAAGLAWLARPPGPAAALRPAPAALTLAVLALQGLTLAWYHPYYLSYYSPLLGGGPAAQRSLLIGWGEGMDQVGAWLRSQPDIGGGQVLSALDPTLQPFVPVPVRPVRSIDAGQANYAVAYLESLQRGDAPAIYDRIAATVPLHSVVIHGIAYARIHQLPRPYATPLPAEFGGWLGLWGYTLERQPGRLTLTPAWDVRAAPTGDYTLFMHLYGPDGRRVAQIDLPPGGADLPPTSQWRPGQQIGLPLPMDLPPDLPAGRYRLALGLYDPASGARLPLGAGPPADAALAGPDALQVAEIALGAP